MQNNLNNPNKMISVAPMMAYTDRHCRYFHRLLSKDVLLYTEMITTGALVFGDREHYLQPELLPGPVSYQLGGSDPKDLAKCASWVEQAGFSEVNLNVGCPSDRVQRGCFGLSLLKTPELVIDCIAAMKAEVKNIPVTVKTRIGYDHCDDYATLVKFIESLIKVGCDHVTVHARKGWLEGLNPHQNRTIPPLKYDIVYKLKEDFPDFSIGINGGVKTLDEINNHLNYVDEVMVGRAFYHNPYLLAQLSENNISRESIVYQMADYADKLILSNENKARERKYQTKISHIAKAMLGLYSGERCGKLWRGNLGDKMHKVGIGSGDLLRESLSVFEKESEGVIS